MMLDATPVLDAEIADSDDIILTAENITKIFPGTVALDDVSFHVRKGKVNVLIGENGAGSSNLRRNQTRRVSGQRLQFAHGYPPGRHFARQAEISR